MKDAATVAEQVFFQGKLCLDAAEDRESVVLTIWTLKGAPGTGADDGVEEVAGQRETGGVGEGEGGCDLDEEFGG